MQTLRLFKCVFDSSKKSFCKSFNAIFGMIAHPATAEVVIHLSKVKSLHVLLYGLKTLFFECDRQQIS